MPSFAEEAKRKGVPLLNRPREILATAGPVAVLAAVGIAPLAFGGVHALSHAGLALLAVGGGVCHLADRARRHRPLLVPWPAAIFIVAAGATLLTLLPLPGFLLDVASPAMTELRDWVVASLGDDRRALVRPVLAVDPPATASALLRTLSALAVFLVVADRARRDRTRVRIYRFLVVAGVVTLTVPVIHTVLRLDEIYGVLAAAEDGLLRGPLVNPNHLARVLGAFCFLAVAFLPEIRGRTERVVVTSAAAALGVGCLLAYSRGGMLAFVAVGALGLFFWFLPSRPSGSTSGDERAPVVGPLVALVVVAFTLWIAYDKVAAELSTLGAESLESSKAMLYEPALRLTAAHAWAGVGPGGFGFALPTVLELGELPGKRFTHVENLLLETLVSHGFVVGAGLLATGAATAWHLLRRIPSQRKRGPLLVLAFLLVGDLFDFVLSIPAGLLLVAAALGLASAHALQSGAPAYRLGRRSTALAGLALVALTAWGIRVGVVDDGPTTDDRLAEMPAGPARIEALERAVARHPFDTWYAYALAREARTAQDPERAIHWANRALVLDPNNGSAHVEAARALWVYGRREQAFVEYRLAWKVAPLMRAKIIREVARRTEDLSERLAAVPTSDPAAFKQVCELIRAEKRAAVELACWDRAAAAFPEVTEFASAAVQSALEVRDAEGARRRLTRLLEEDPLDGRAVRQLGQAIALAGDVEEAFSTMERYRSRVATNLYELDWWQIAVARRLGRHREALELIEASRSRATRGQQNDLDHLEADVLEALGRKADALLRWRRLADRLGNPDLRVRQARLELELGLKDHAATSIAKIARERPDHQALPDLKRKLESLGKAAPGFPQPPRDR